MRTINPRAIILFGVALSLTLAAFPLFAQESTITFNIVELGNCAYKSE